MTNEFFTDDYTSVLQKLIREVVNDPATYMGAALLPSVASPTRKIRNEVVEASGGMTKEHLPGTEPKYIQGFGSRVQEFSPAFYKEAIRYDEEKILFLRELGQNDPSRRGIRQYIDLDIDKLNRRLETRIEYERWQAIFNGGFTWMGKTISFGIPAGNTATPLGADWSSDGISADNSANPLIDLRYWLTGGYAPFRKYTVRRAIMNPNTARWILDNSNTRSYVQNALANPAVAAYGLNEVLNFFIPGCPKMEIYNGWYQEETLDTATGKVSVGNAQYFVPDGRIFFEVTNLPGGDKLGNFAQTVHLATGSIEAPGYGKFLVTEENIAPGTKGGPGNPYVDVWAGVYGAPNLERPFDVLTATVYTA